MLQLLRDPQYDFMSRGKVLLGISTACVLASIAVLFIKGVDLGIEFTGGTEVQLKYAEAPDLARVRSTLEQSGLRNAIVTTIGPPGDHEVYIRLGGGGDAAAELTTAVTAALRAESVQAGRLDLNEVDSSALKTLLSSSGMVSSEQAKSLAETINQRRKELALVRTMEDLSIEEMTPEIREFLSGKTYFGPLALRSQSYVGPAVGRELLDKAVKAILGALVAMLVYIWIRFQLQWGIAAVLALAHDTLLTLGLFSLFGMELTLSIVAAFLTLVGYSVNDTVVIFDRVRENLRNRGTSNLAATINESINQTLSRSLITSGLTWLTCFGLFVFGGPALAPFGFVLSIGIIVGSYSTLYIASPILMIAKEIADRRRAAAEPPTDTVRRAKKVRGPSSGTV